MKISKKSINTNYLCFLFFLLGLNKFIIYLPAAFIYFFIFEKKHNLNKSFIIYCALNITTIIFIFILGYDRMTPDEPIKLFIVFICVLLISGFLIQDQSKSIQANLLAYYILGVGLEATIIAGYSYLFNDGSYGYGKIYNPFTHTETNSPITSNNLSILASLLIFYLFNKGSFSAKIFYAFLLIIIINLGIFLGGRTFFIILLFALLYSVIRPLSISKLIFISGFILCILLISNHINDIIDTDFILKRFEKGLESKRFLHYKHGINQFFNHPLGGYTIDESIEKTRWFHNIFLDMGRLGGWIPVGLFSLSLAYVVLKTCKKMLFADTHYNFAILMLLISFLILQQDTSIEGDYRAYVTMYLSAILLLSNSFNHFNFQYKYD